MLSIKGLFNSTNLLNKFEEIHFESTRAFINAYKTKIIKLKNQRISINIHTSEDYDQVLKLINNIEVGIFNLNIRYPILDYIFERGLINGTYSITTDKLDGSIIQYWDKNKEWIRKNPLCIDITIKYSNYKNQISKILDYFNNKKIRFFRIEFDWCSFENMRLKELHTLEFWLNELRTWYRGSRDEKYSHITQPLELIQRSGLNVFVSEDLKLYLNEEAFKDKEALFDLGKNIGKTGEDIPFKELNTFRSYYDLHKRCIVPPVKNPRFVNWYQNKKLMGNYNELPWIEIIVGELLDI